jgi:hypothetical protein
MKKGFAILKGSGERGKKIGWGSHGGGIHGKSFDDFSNYTANFRNLGGVSYFSICCENIKNVRPQVAAVAGAEHNTIGTGHKAIAASLEKTT